VAALAGCLAGADSGSAPASDRNSSSITIAVPEGVSADGDVGFQQLWRLFVSEGLVARDVDGRPVPLIAESWRPSDDDLRWTIDLRPDLYFHDGTRCDAAAVRTVLESSLRRPEVTSLFPGLLDVQEVRTDGDLRVVVHLRRPSSFLLDDLNVQITKRLPDGSIVGTGPFYAVATSATEVRLRAHPRYWKGTPKIAEVVVRSVPTLRQAWASLLRSEIDVVSNVPADAEEFLRAGRVRTFRFQRHYAYVLAFNARRPELARTEVRRALNAAVDRDAIVADVLQGMGRPAYSPVWPEHWAYDGTVDQYTFDPSLVRATLTAAGLQPQDDAGPSRLRFRCLVPSGHALFERLALVLQRQLYDVGVDLELEAVELAEMDGRLRAGHFDAALLDMVSAPTLSRVYQFWRSPGDLLDGLNLFGYHNADADRWLDGLRFATGDMATRLATGQLQRTLLEDPPAIFLAWSERARAIGERIDVQAAPGADPFQAIAEWEIAEGITGPQS